MSYFATNLPQEKHCFFGAEGGVSKGKYASLNTNLKSQDNKILVEQNFEIMAQYFKLKKSDMFTLNQGVSANVVEAVSPQWFEQTADGVVTTNPQILIGLKTADCAPVLLADYKNGVVGAAHAGWRGAYKGIVENVVALMLKKGANIANIQGAIGPCMQQKSFEVGNDAREIFLQLNNDNQKYFIFGKDNLHWQLDLSGYLVDKMKKLGINKVVNSGIDTYPAENGYFSYRRNTHLGLITTKYDYPTQYSFIKL